MLDREQTGPDRHSVESIKYRTPTPEVGATHMLTNRWRDK